MDNDNENIFGTGNSGPAREPVGNNNGIPGADSGVKGRIDPALAIAAGGAGGNNGGSAPDYSGKRGRHPGNCVCGPCTAKRNGTEKTPGGLGDNPSEPKPEKTRNIRASFIEKSLYTLHLVIASALKAPELELEDDDAKKLGEATAGVLAFYKVKMTAKQEAYGLLMEAAAQVYPPMIMTLYIRKKFEAEEARKNKPAPAPKPSAPPPPPRHSNVTPLRDVNQPAFDPLNINMPRD